MQVENFDAIRKVRSVRVCFHVAICVAYTEIDFWKNLEVVREDGPTGYSECICLGTALVDAPGSLLQFVTI